MSKVIVFNIKGIESIIQCDPKEKIKDIYERFILTIESCKYESYFAYNGKKIKDDLTFQQIANTIDRKRNIINIFIQENNTEFKNNFTLSKGIICPKCNENINIEIDDYKINLYNCKNKHQITNILFNEFDKIQKMKYMNCDLCKMNKNSYEKIYYCHICQQNLCKSCKLNHIKDHKIIYYEDLKAICNKHNFSFIEFCDLCKENLCNLCLNKHKNHDIIHFPNIPKKENIINQLSDFRNIIDKFNNEIEFIINKLKTVISNIKNYYFKSYSIINYYLEKKNNYYILQNINEFLNYNNIIINDINLINNSKNIYDKFKFINELFNRMNYKTNILFIKLKKNPNLKFKYNISNTNGEYGAEAIFEVFSSSRDNKNYIAINTIRYNIDIFNLDNFKKILSLKGHDHILRT